jgi:sterol desaturase/sphingolipid hydroxylase (fatty acid hydroxylase superfamily)
MFGTLHLPGNRHPDRYGIDQKLPSSVFGQLVEPFRKKK